MTRKDQFHAQAKTILQRHYSHILNGRQITDKEVTDEIASLQRKEAKGSLDDNGERLYAAIFK
jgi:hypothetical protein